MLTSETSIRLFDMSYINLKVTGSVGTVDGPNILMILMMPVGEIDVVYGCMEYEN